MVVELVHQQEFKGQDGVGKLFSVPFKVPHKLGDGDIELFHFTGQIHTSQPVETTEKYMTVHIIQKIKTVKIYREKYTQITSQVY